MNWQDVYEKKIVSAEEAVKIVKSRDRVVMTGSTDQPKVLPQALFARKSELRDVEIVWGLPLGDPGFFLPGSEDSFKTVIASFIGPMLRTVVNERRTEFIPNSFASLPKPTERTGEKDCDVYMVTLSPPNKQGFCSLGGELWGKKEMLYGARKTIAEVDNNQLWYYGDTTVHISEIDYFVEHTPRTFTFEEIPSLIGNIEPESRREQVAEFLKELPRSQHGTFLSLLPFFSAIDDQMFGHALESMGILVPEVARPIAGYVSSLVEDGDTFQIGMGSPSQYIPRLGAFDNKHDLGYHAEMTARGVGDLIRNGIITGKSKNLHQGKAVFSSLTGLGPNEMEWCSENPGVELYGTTYVTNMKTVAANDRMVSINNAISVDLTGQICSETALGTRIINGPGGQPESHIGAYFSKGGKAITVLPSTALEGAVSNICALFDQGTVVTIPRTFADFVVTEYGIARLAGKTLRERANELIAVAHPDFRAELRKEAEKLYWP